MRLPRRPSLPALDRHRVAAACMAATVVLATAGAWLHWGLGVGLMVAAGLLFVVALLVGWESD